MKPRAVVTGAFSNTGAAVAAELLRRGYKVETLTNRVPLSGSPIKAELLRFDLEHLMSVLKNADVFVSTYWIRLPRDEQTFVTAVDRGRLLLDAAVSAGVRRIVQVSVANASAGSHLAYFAGKAELEQAVRSSGAPSWAIVRPTMVVGPGDVLTNNIAWFLRRTPVFLVPNGGRYRLQPVTLADTARIIADAAVATGNLEVDAAGPEVFTFREYLGVLARACGVHRQLLSVPAWMALVGLRLAGAVLRDRVLVREELQCLRDELLISRASPLGKERVSDWLLAHGQEFGRRYVNDDRRHFGAGRSRPILDPNQL